jgi:hypothetical protein
MEEVVLDVRWRSARSQCVRRQSNQLPFISRFQLLILPAHSATQLLCFLGTWRSHPSDDSSLRHELDRGNPRNLNLRCRL